MAEVEKINTGDVEHKTSRSRRRASTSLWRHPRHQGRRRRDRGQDGHRLHRPVGLRQVDVPALPQPDERHDRHLPRDRRDQAGQRGHLRPRTRSIRCSCAPRSAWCSRNRTRSRSRSMTTSPTVRGSTVWRRPRRISTGSSRQSLKKAALWDEVKDRLDEPGTGMSGGQQQRLCIARAIATSPEVLLMDEPCSALDPIATAQVEELIDELRENYSVVIVTHSMQQAGPGQPEDRVLPPRPSAGIRRHVEDLHQPRPREDPAVHYRPLRLRLGTGGGQAYRFGL